MLEIALAPPTDIQELIIKFQRENSESLEGSIYNLKTNIPHLTLHRCNIEESAVTQRTIDRFSNLVSCTLKEPIYFKKVEYTGSSEVWANLGLTEELSILHERVVTALTDSANSGWEYEPGLYKPHITLGGYSTEKHKCKVLESYNKLLKGRVFKPSTVIAYSHQSPHAPHILHTSPSTPPNTPPGA